MWVHRNGPNTITSAHEQFFFWTGEKFHRILFDSIHAAEMQLKKAYGSKIHRRENVVASIKMKNDCLVRPKIQFTETSGLSSDSKYQTKELAALHAATKATERFIPAFKFDLNCYYLFGSCCSGHYSLEIQSTHRHTARASEKLPPSNGCALVLMRFKISVCIWLCDTFSLSLYLVGAW